MCVEEEKMEIALRVFQQVDIPLIKKWLTAKENSKWLSSFFQAESVTDGQIALYLMKRDRSTFVIECDGVAVGIMGLTNVDEINRSAEIWSVIGDGKYRRRGISSMGFILTLQRAFGEMRMHSVNGWATEGNFTIRIFEKLGFTLVGRQRECHLHDGLYKDRILYDILQGEFSTGPFAQVSGRS